MRKFIEVARIKTGRNLDFCKMEFRVVTEGDVVFMSDDFSKAYEYCREELGATHLTKETLTVDLALREIYTS